MKRRTLQIAAGPGDFVPLVIGCVVLFVSLPAFVLMMADTEQNFGALRFPVTLLLGIGVVIGLGFLLLGVQVNSEPGSLVYRLSRGRLFWR